MRTAPPSAKRWFASAVDLRLGSDGLAAIVRTRLAADPSSGHLLVFTNRNADRVKGKRPANRVAIGRVETRR